MRPSMCCSSMPTGRVAAGMTWLCSAGCTFPFRKWQRFFCWNLSIANWSSTPFVLTLVACSAFAVSSFRALCKCIQLVHPGQIWATAQQIDYLIDLITQVPSLRVVNANGNTLLTPREEQVVALVAEGLSNREIAQELGLSEHTVKKHLFRIFNKLGISTRVELVLYAVNYADHRAAEWLSGNA